MSTIVYHQQGNLQNLQSCLEMTTTIKLKVTPPPPEVKDVGGWSFLQNLSNISKDTAAEKETTAYVHPLARRPSSSRLSEKSLALCTEPLGSETGTDMTESSIFSALAFSEPNGRQEEALPPSDCHQVSKTGVVGSPVSRAGVVGSPELGCNPLKNVTATYHKSMNNNRNSRNNNFPPPLTTISGVNSLRVRPHREGGRLIIRAVETPSKRPYLRAERSNGRLRLCFFNDNDDDCSLADDHFDPQITTSEENDDDSEEFKDESDEFEGDINGGDEGAEVEEQEEYGEEEESDLYMARDMDGNTFDVEVEMGMNKCLLGRCKEGGHSNKRLCHWGEPKPLWVTT